MNPLLPALDSTLARLVEVSGVMVAARQGMDENFALIRELCSQYVADKRQALS